jgi:hypothetical protein
MAALLAMTAGCANPMAPQPPALRLSRTVDNLSGVRKGHRVTLTWSPTTETTERESVRWPTTTRICRIVNQFPLGSCGQPVAVITNSELASSHPGGHRPVVSFEDVLPDSLLSLQAQATYAVEIVNPRGRSAGLSNQIRVTLAPTEAPPASFRILLDAEGPRLSWNLGTLPPASAELSHRMRIYRRALGHTEVTLVAEQPVRLGEGEARDRDFEWERTYEYWIAPVTVLTLQGRPALEAEGEDSKALRLVVHDIFPPVAPAGVEAVYSSVGQKPFIDGQHGSRSGRIPGLPPPSRH